MNHHPNRPVLHQATKRDTKKETCAKHEATAPKQTGLERGKSEVAAQKQTDLAKGKLEVIAPRLIGLERGITEVDPQKMNLTATTTVIPEGVIAAEEAIVVIEREENLIEIALGLDQGIGEADREIGPVDQENVTGRGIEIEDHIRGLVDTGRGREIVVVGRGPGLGGDPTAMTGEGVTAVHMGVRDHAADDFRFSTKKVVYFYILILRG